MYNFVPDRYGTWIDQTKQPYEIVAKVHVKQIQIDNVAHTGNNYTISYWTEGARDDGEKVLMVLKKLENSVWIEKQYDINLIDSEWNNFESISFIITEDGSYKAEASIRDSSGSYYPDVWYDELIFTRP